MLYGNAVVGQSGGPTAAINASLAGVVSGAYSCGMIGRLFGMKNGVEGLLEGRLCELELSAEDIGLLKNTPASALGSCRKKLPEPEEEPEVFERLFEIFREYNIRFFFYIGGNDSMDTVAKLSRYKPADPFEMRFIGVPKTIDNDVAGTDHTPGYGSAAKYIAVTMQEILRDCAVYSTKAVTIVEIMGRDAGWLTAAAALPGLSCGIAPDYIYLPERPFSVDGFFRDVETALGRHPNVVIAVSEGIRDADGNYIGAAGHKGLDVFGHVNLSGTGKALELAVKEKLGCKVRSIELNVLQRCASHIASKTDIDESFEVGRAAVEAACAGTTGVMMTFRRVSTAPYEIEIVPGDISEIANKVKSVPQSFICAEGNNVTRECAEYILSLIVGETAPIYLDGMPVHYVIK